MAWLLPLLLSILAPAMASAQDGAAGGLSVEAQSILVAINDARAQAGLGPLAENALLSQAAQAHANDVLWNNTYSHWGSDGTLVDQRVARTGYAQNPWVSENWVSSSSPEGAMQWWMNDYSHRVNILTPRWVEVGVGTAVEAGSGEMIFVTVFSAGRGEGTAVAAAAPAVPQAPPQAASPPVAPIAVPAAGLDYVVQPGDTLLGIALRHGMDWPEVAAANGLQEHSLLQIGQAVRIPGSGESPAAPGIGGPVGGSGKPYTVQSGETLFSIAARHGLTWQELAAFNSMGENDVLHIDQVIQLPVAVEAASAAEQDAEATVDGQPSPEPAAESMLDPEAESAVEPAAVDESPVLYTMQEGDTIFGVALAQGVDWLEVLALNGLTEDSLIQPGQQIRLR